MRRRDFIAVGGGVLSAWPLGTKGQPAVAVIGFLSSRSANEAEYILAPFRAGLKEAGFVEGQNVAVEYRWAEGQNARVPALAADLVNRRVAVIVAGGTAHEGKAATTTIPVVFTTG